MRSVVVSLLLVGACGDDGKGSTPPPGAGSLYSTEVKEGIATYYDATGAGNCGFDATPGDLDVAAFDANSYAGHEAQQPVLFAELDENDAAAGPRQEVDLLQAAQPRPGLARGRNDGLPTRNALGGGLVRGSPPPRNHGRFEPG
jgi:hypothetical protein